MCTILRLRESSTLQSRIVQSGNSGRETTHFHSRQNPLLLVVIRQNLQIGWGHPVKGFK